MKLKKISLKKLHPSITQKRGIGETYFITERHDFC